jgi:hypothetical protein
MAYEDEFRFTITGTLRTDAASVRTALLPIVEEVLQDGLRRQGLEPINESVAAQLSADVVAQALAEMTGDTPEGLVKALAERLVFGELAKRLPSSELVDTVVDVERAG